MSAIKFDEAKARFDLLPADALYELAQLYTTGAAKYGDRNWEEGFDFGRVFAAMQRHAWRWWAGEEHDAEDGQHHLTSVAWCALALRHFLLQNKGTDDRPSARIPTNSDPQLTLPL